jgi:sensor histidine kinase regulating citrate/malate metabolism
MGLYYIKQVVEELRGRLELQENKETGETVFHIVLPLNEWVQGG